MPSLRGCPVGRHIQGPPIDGFPGGVHGASYSSHSKFASSPMDSRLSLIRTRTAFLRYDTSCRSSSSAASAAEKPGGCTCSVRLQASDTMLLDRISFASVGWLVVEREVSDLCDDVVDGSVDGFVGGDSNKRRCGGFRGGIGGSGFWPGSSI